MSGILFVCNFDGRPVDRELLRVATESLRFRGPDAIVCEAHDNVGFACTLLLTDSGQNRPIEQADGVRSLADIRLDAKEELVQKLIGHGCPTSVETPDSELLLFAYRVWKEDCVLHLDGDFSFVIHDPANNRICCGRDRFGVKPLFYCRAAHTLFVTNTLQVLKLFPDVPLELNESAIGDFLLFGRNWDFRTTVYRDIYRVPPSHMLISSPSEDRLVRYWTMPTDGRIRFKDPRDYVLRFRELLNQAVSDRSGDSSTGILMSGGMDSTSVAASLVDSDRKTGKSRSICAYTVGYDRLPIVPEEKRYAQDAASHLGISFYYKPADEYRPFHGYDCPSMQTPEPWHDPFAMVYNDLLSVVESDRRVLLTGYGGDPLLNWSVSSCSASFLPELLPNVLSFVLSTRQFPRIGLRTWLKRNTGLVPAGSWEGYPDWLVSDFENRYGLRSRWEQAWARSGKALHASRNEAYLDLAKSFWPYLFESWDPGHTRQCVEVRHPYFDRRLLAYVLSIPPLPWFSNKHLLRIAMKDALPESVLTRAKAVLDVDFSELLIPPNRSYLEEFLADSEIARDYLRVDVVRSILKREIESRGDITNPLALILWLKNYRKGL